MSQMEVVPLPSSTLPVDPQSSQYEDVVRTVTYLERLREQQPEYAANLVAWCEHRIETIGTIEKLHGMVQALHSGCNFTRAAGLAAGILGIIAGIAGFFLDKKGHESAEDLKKVGGYCAGGGLFAVVSSTGFEVGLSQIAINKITSVLKRDIELTEPLRHPIMFSREVEYQVNQLFQCSTASDTFVNVIKVCRHCIELFMNGSEMHVLMMDVLNNRMVGFEDMPIEAMQNAYSFLQRINQNRRMIEPAWEIIRLFRETPNTFDFVRLGARLYNRVYEYLDIQPLAFLQSDANSKLVRYALDTSSIAFHVVSILLSVKDIQDSKSQYCEALNRVKFALKEELTNVEQQMNAQVKLALRIEYDNRKRLDL